VTERRVILVKHALPVLDPTKPAREWTLAAEGENQARRLAARLRTFAPCRLVSSTEPKASRTAAIVARELGIETITVAELCEIDRPVLPILSPLEHARLNLRIFSNPDAPVVGRESAREAQRRFGAALFEELQRTTEDNLVVVTHGTVISLFVSAHANVDGAELWQRLQCPSFVVLERATLSLVEVVAQLD